jgi:hypothetical protein
MTNGETAEYLELNREVILELIGYSVLPVDKKSELVKINRSDIDRPIASGALPTPRPFKLGTLPETLLGHCGPV